MTPPEGNTNLTAAIKKLLDSLPKRLERKLERIAKQRGKRVEQIVEEALVLYEAQNPKPSKALETLRKKAVTDYFKKLGDTTAAALGETGRKKRASAGGVAKTGKMSEEDRLAWNAKMLEARRSKKAAKEKRPGGSKP